MPLTKEQIQKYIVKFGLKCPYCGEPTLEGDHVEITGGGANQKISCGNCEKTWFDIYTLTGIEEN